MKLSDILFNQGIELNRGIKDINIEKITVFPNEIDESSLFIIISSDRAPRFSELQKLPAAILCDKDTPTPEGIITVRVSNVRSAMSHAYSAFSEITYRKMKFIGVTGTNGKTTTAYFIKRILTDAGYKVGFIGTGAIECGNDILSNKNYSMTTPDPWILYPAIKIMQERGCDFVVMEVSSHSLALDKTAPIIFDYGIFTNLTPEHMDFHGDIDAYFSAKNKLFSSCKTGVFNIDDKYARRASREFSGKRINVGVLWKGDVYATHISDMGFDGIKYMYRTHNLIFRMDLCVAGLHNVYNSMLASAVCCDIGVKPCEVKRSFGNILSIPGRFEIIKAAVTVIIDYAHTPAALEALLMGIQQANAQKHKLTVVFGCGGERDKKKRPQMACISEKYADSIIVTSDNCRNEPAENIISDIVAGFTKENYEIVVNRKEAIEKSILSCVNGEIVAIVGKGAEKYSIDQNGYSDFDEKEIINNSLALRSGAKNYES